MNPKQKLQAAPNFRDVASLINSPLLEHCLEVALVTLMENLESSEPAKSFHQFEGARRFIRTLKGLAELPSQPKPNRIGQLNPQ